jgi:hypothetical protein
VKSFLTVVAPSGPSPKILAVAVHATARQQVERLSGWFDHTQIAHVRVGTSQIFRPSAIARIVALVSSRGLRGLRLVHAINTRHDFLVACRVASGLACHARARSILGRLRPAAVVVSSDTNPEEVGFVSAARALGIRTVFISHAYPSPFSPPLDFDLSILEGEAAVDARGRLGPIKGKVVLAGVEGESAPLDVGRFESEHPVIGILAPKVVAWPKLAEIVADCRHHFRARQVLIRWHPSMLEPPQLDQKRAGASGVVETDAREGLRDVVRRCDWVIGDENSNVHLPALKLGIPTVAVRNLGTHLEGGGDVYGFQASRIVYPPVSSLSDLNISNLVAFFSGDWAQRFARYDASYLRSGELIEREARDAIQRLVDGS